MNDVIVYKMKSTGCLIYYFKKIVLLRVTEVGKIIRKKKRPLLLARSVEGNPSLTERASKLPFLMWSHCIGLPFY